MEVIIITLLRGNHVEVCMISHPTHIFTGLSHLVNYYKDK